MPDFILLLRPSLLHQGHEKSCRTLDLLVDDALQKHRMIEQVGKQAQYGNLDLAFKLKECVRTIFSALILDSHLHEHVEYDAQVSGHNVLHLWVGSALLHLLCQAKVRDELSRGENDACLADCTPINVYFTDYLNSSLPGT